MNKKQFSCLERVRKALDACHKAGLEGGVYESSFYAWPKKYTDEICDSGWRFFPLVNKYGGMARSEMRLDGGAGT